jgi:hypothetical protein
LNQIVVAGDLGLQLFHIFRLETSNQSLSIAFKITHH